MRYGFVVLATICSLAIGGCTIEDEGAIDYRRVVKTEPVPDKKTHPDTTPSEQRPQSPDLAQLGGKYSDLANPAAKIRKGEFYQITLKQAFIKEFYDLWSLAAFRFEEDGEIAIVANVFEIGDGRQITFGPQARQQANVIFFSGDVKQGQYLNFSQLPLYGPAEYKEGNSVVVQLIGVEIDEIDDRTMSLLKKMAQLGNGAATTYNPLVGAASQVLTDLALAFLNGKHDDIIFFYTFTMGPSRQSDYVKEDYLSEGTRVLVKVENRAQNFDWDSLQYDRNAGRLWKTDKVSNSQSEFRDESYVVVDVTRTDPGLSEAKFQSLTKLLEEVRTNNALSEKEIEKIEQSAGTLAREFSGQQIVQNRAGIIEDKEAQPGERRAAIFGLLTSIKTALTEIGKGDQGKPLMSEASIEKGLNRLSAIVAKDKGFDLSELSPAKLKDNPDLNALTTKIVHAIETAETEDVATEGN